ncbi:MAG: hypothetical protein IT449_12565 [Phycisphaerales bacterium]|nr:hypothetical protein [Phycisphaerales bacterium]
MQASQALTPAEVAGYASFTSVCLQDNPASPVAQDKSASKDAAPSAKAPANPIPDKPEADKPVADKPAAPQEPKYTIEPVLPPDEAVKQALAAFDRLDQGGDVQKEAAEITRLYKMVLDSAKDNPHLMYIRGRSAILSGRVVDGMQDLEAFAKTTPGQSDWKTFRILGDLHLKDYPRLAEGKYCQALELNDLEPTILLGLSQAQFRLGQRKEALQLAERAVQLDAGKTVTYLDNFAAMLRLDGENDKSQLDRAAGIVNQAVQLVQAALKERPTDPSLIQLLATEYESALIVLRDILAATPDNAAAYADVAAISENLGELRRQLLMHEAIALIESQALPRLQGKVTAPLAMSYARLLEQVGRIGDARRVYEKTIEGEPEFQDAKTALDRINKQYPPDPAAPATEPEKKADAPPSPLPATKPGS